MFDRAPRLVHIVVPPPALGGHRTNSRGCLSGCETEANTGPTGRQRTLPDRPRPGGAPARRCGRSPALWPVSSAVARLRRCGPSPALWPVSGAVAGFGPSHTSRPKVSHFVYRPAEGAGAFGWAVNDCHAKFNRFAAQETCGQTRGGVGDPRPAPSTNAT